MPGARFDRRRLLTGAAALGATAPAARSVLLLVGDDHSPVAGCYGNTVVSTPNLDRLAGRGVRFDHAFCTTASCSASRSVILTGLHNHRNGQYGHAHAPHNFHTHLWVHPVPRLAKAQGCATGVIGKLHVLPPEVYTWDVEAAGRAGNRDVHDLASRAAAFLRNAGGRPFFLQVGFSDPHRAARGFANEPDYPRVRRRACAPADVTVPPFLSDAPETRRELAGYYEAINRLDQGVGMVLEALEDSGRAADTMVVYLGDNGMPFPGAKGSCYDSGLHVPLIVATPALRRRGMASRALVHFPDIAPTVMEWMGLAAPPYPLDGRSLLPILEQEQPAGWDEVFFSHTFHEINNYYPARGVRTRRYKYVKYLFPELAMPLPSDLFDSPTWQGVLRRKDARMGARRTAAVLRHAGEELFDLEKDPLETTNLAGSEEVAGALTDLRARMDAFRRRTKDPWLIVDRQRAQA